MVQTITIRNWGLGIFVGLALLPMWPQLSQAATYGSGTYGGGTYNNGSSRDTSTSDAGGGSELDILPTPNILQPTQLLMATQKIRIKAKAASDVTSMFVTIGKKKYLLYDDGKHDDGKRGDRIYSTFALSLAKGTAYTVTAVYPTGQATAKGKISITNKLVARTLPTPVPTPPTKISFLKKSSQKVSKLLTPLTSKSVLRPPIAMTPAPAAPLPTKVIAQATNRPTVTSTPPHQGFWRSLFMRLFSWF